MIIKAYINFLSASGCPPSTFQCYEDFVKFKCVHQNLVCDNQAQCLGAYDEVNCGKA